MIDKIIILKAISLVFAALPKHPSDIINVIIIFEKQAWSSCFVPLANTL
jgi:hypothetical protein